MTNGYTPDSVVRQALQNTGIGELSRRHPDLQRIGRRTRSTRLSSLDDDDSGWRSERITYTVGDTILVAAFCVTDFGMPKGTYSGVITPVDVERARTVSARAREVANTRYEKKLAAWEKKHPNPSVVDNFSRPMPEGILGDRGQQYGILVDSQRDTNLYTARIEELVIQYVHRDAIMNVEKHAKTTEMTKDQLLEVMNTLKGQYTVERHCLKKSWF